MHKTGLGSRDTSFLLSRECHPTPALRNCQHTRDRINNFPVLEPGSPFEPHGSSPSLPVTLNFELFSRHDTLFLDFFFSCCFPFVLHSIFPSSFLKHVLNASSLPCASLEVGSRDISELLSWSSRNFSFNRKKHMPITGAVQ